MDTLAQHLRLGARSLLRAPGFAAAAILTLALGIGLSTAVFTVADALLLRRLPVRDQARVVVVAGETPDGRFSNYPLDLDGARDFAARTRTLARVASFQYEGATPVTVREGGSISRLRRALVSGDYFDVLGARPALGRGLRPEDDVRGAAPVLVLSHRAWREQFGGTPDVVGRRVLMHEDGVAYTVVGVMPAGLEHPRGAEAWSALRAATAERNLPYVAVNVIGRLAPGATPANARDEMTAYFRRDGAPPPMRDLRGVVRTLPELVVGDTRPAVLAFVAASALLLLITCVNVANLLLVRGLARVREVAVRSALGAGRARIVRQLLTEHALLGAAGGALGVAVAAGAVRAFVAFAPARLPRLDEVALDGTALAAALLITALAVLLAAVAPAVLTARSGTADALRAGARHGAGRPALRVTEVLVAGQVALALLVLSAAALVGRSLVQLQRAELHLEPSHLLVAELALRADAYDTAPKQLALLDRLLPEVRGIAGVRDATPIVAAPFAESGWDGQLAAEGQTPEQAAANPMLDMQLVGPTHFATLGQPVVHGRGFTDADRAGAPAVVMLSASAARHYWPGEDAIGRRLTMGPASAPRAFTVVGVVPDARFRDLRETRPSIYFPLAQSFFPFAPTTLAIRTVGAPGDVVPALRRVLAETAPDVALASAAPFDAFLARPLAQPRMNALLLAVFAAAAVALAAIGLFGVLATAVRLRTRELGVRQALGATPGDVGRLVLRHGLRLAAAGAAVGMLGALATNRLLAALLFEVSPTDAVTLVGVAAALLAVAALAALVPARASGRVEPAVALRAD